MASLQCEHLLVGSSHAVSLAGARLTVGKNCDVVSSKELRHDFLDGSLVELLVGAVLPEGEVVSEGLHWVCIVEKHLKYQICNNSYIQDI